MIADIYEAINACVAEGAPRDSLIVLCGPLAYAEVVETQGIGALAGVPIYREPWMPSLQWRVQQVSDEMKKSLADIAKSISEFGGDPNSIAVGPRSVDFTASLNGRQSREITDKTFNAWCRDQRRDYPYRKPDWINDGCSAEWSRRLRELQAEAREKERCQVTIDPECVG